MKELYNKQKVLDVGDIIAPIARAISHALCFVEERADGLVGAAAQCETCPQAKWALEQIAANNEIARSSGALACQDCGQAVLFVTLGTGLKIVGDLSAALNAGVIAGYKNARKSVADPLTRLNTTTNAPAVIHYEINSGSALEVTYLAKGAGSENMSRIYMLTPSKGTQGIIDSAVDCVRLAGANPCPPIVLGVGVGGTFESCAILAKKALTTPTGAPNPREDLRDLEQRILQAVNATKIGAQGFGGDTTCLAVSVAAAPTHIGMLPVAINLQCHSVRHFTLVF